MNKSIYLKLFVGLIVLSHKKLNTNCSELSLGKLIGTSACSLLSLEQLGRCSDQFKKEVERGRLHKDEYGRRVVCCAVNDLKDCMVKPIGEKCGENMKEASGAIMDAMASGIPENCDGYFSGSPLCYSDITIVGVGIGLAVISLLTICLICKVCCCCCC